MNDEVPPYLQHRGIGAALARVPALLYKLGLGPLLGRRVLLLSTTGRRSGRPRATPLSYQRLEDTLYLLSEAGTHANWYRNIAKDPIVRVQVGGRRFQAVAERVSDPQLVAQVLRLFNRASPRVAQRFYGIPPRATDEELLTLASRHLVVALREKRT